MAATTALLIASVVISVVGTMVAAQQRAKAHRYNAKVAEQRAQRERELGVLQAQRFAEEQSRLLARQRAGFGFAGVLPSVGSPLLVQETTAVQGKFQENLIRAGANTTAAGYEAQAKQSRSQAGQELIGAGLRAGSTILGGASKLDFGPSPDKGLGLQYTGHDLRNQGSF